MTEGKMAKGAVLKRCTQCHQYLPLASFARNASRKDGLQDICRDDMAKYWKSPKAERVPLKSNGTELSLRLEIPEDVSSQTIFEKEVPLDKMFVHTRDLQSGYARTLRENRVQKLIQEWDWRAVGVIYLSLHDDGRYAIIDGQHRWEAAKRLGYKGLDAYVYIDLTVAQEAELYRRYGEYLKQTALDRYHAGITARLPEFMALKRILDEVGLKVPQTGKGTSMKMTINSIESVTWVAEHFDVYILTDTLTLLRDLWEDNPRTWNGNFVKGTAHFLARYQKNSKFRKKRLFDIMQRRGLNYIEEKAGHLKASGQAGDYGVAFGQQLLILYNTQLGENHKLGVWTTFITDRGRKEIKERQTGNTHRNGSQNGQSDSYSIPKRIDKEPTTEIVCPTCHAKKGYRCKDLKGTWMATPHPDRVLRDT